MPMNITRFALALGVVAALPWGPSSSAQAKDRALVVGVNTYSGITDNGLHGKHDLGGPVFDAQTFQGLLETQFHVAADDIHTLIDAQATHDAILDQFKTFLIDGSAPGDRVFFFFAGHGIAIKVPDGPDKFRLTSGLAPADTSGDLAQQPTDIKGLILGVEMRRLLEQIHDRVVMVMVDACQSGSVSRGIGQHLVVPPNIKVRTLTPTGAVGMTIEAFEADAGLRQQAKGRLLDIVPTSAPSSPQSQTVTQSAPADGSLSVWSAATVDQVTFDLGTRPGGIFTQSFAEGLRDKKAVTSGGDITAGALLNYVRDQAKSFCTDLGSACSAGLTPQLVAPPTYLTEPVLGSAEHTEGQPTAHQEPSPKAAGQIVADKLTGLLSHHNDFDLEASILPGSTVRIGQHLQFRITSAEAGKVVVFFETPDGDLTQLFPNAHTDRSGRIRAHAPLTIPDAYWGVQFTARPPAGPGSILVLVTEDGIDLSKATQTSLGFKPLVETSRLLQVIATEVQKPVVSPILEVPTREARWAFARVPFTIVGR